MSGPAPATLDVRVEDRCALVTLSRPERLNAIDRRMFLELERCADELGARDDVGVIVLTGAGRAFCAGADLLSFPEEMEIGSTEAVREHMRWVGDIVEKWLTIATPTIAAVNGPALGGGCNLALLCDLVLMREDASIGQVYAQRALAVDMGGTWLLPRLVGRARAMELGLLGDALTAAEAERIGLVNRCVPAPEWKSTVDAWARRLAGGASVALRLIKSGLVESWVSSLDEALEREADAIARVFQTDDAREAFTAFREKREPRYQGR